MKGSTTLILENKPRLYFLSWNPEIPAIILGIHKGWMNYIENYGFTSPIPSPDFKTDFDKEIGFDGVFKKVNEDEDFIHYAVELPNMEIQTDKICHHCNGSGENSFLPESKCPACHGTGKEYILDWTKIKKISASFGTLLNELNSSQYISPPAPFQLMEINTSTKILWGQISIPLCDWLWSQAQTQDELPEIVKAMKIAYCRMWKIFGESPGNEHHYKMNLKKSGGFIVDCPGIDGEMAPDNWNSLRAGIGFGFGCYDLDDITQVVLLVALAALHDLAVADIG
jgi:hypothetical protein